MNRVWEHIKPETLNRVAQASGQTGGMTLNPKSLNPKP